MRPFTLFEVRPRFAWPAIAVFMLFAVVLASMCVPTFADFDEDDLDDSYSLRAGDRSSCPDKIEFDGVFRELVVKAGEVEINDDACSGGEIVLQKNPSFSDAAQFLARMRDEFGTFIGGTVDGKISCALASLNDNEQVLFFKPDEDDIDVKWAEVLGNPNAPLAQEQEETELDEDAKYVLLGNRCFYEETRLADRVCFPPSAMARLADGSARRMDELRVGDELADLSSSSPSSPLIGWTHADSRARARFIRADTALYGSLVASEGHFVYADGKLRPMKDVRVGMTLSHESGLDVPVSNVSAFISKGVYNPHTLSGDIVVDGFRVSCYTTVIRPSAAHALLAPLRAAFRAIVSFVTPSSPTAH